MSSISINNNKKTKTANLKVNGPLKHYAFLDGTIGTM